MGRAMTFWKPGISMDTARPAWLFVKNIPGKWAGRGNTIQADRGFATSRLRSDEDGYYFKIHKTISKTYTFTFGGNKKLKLDRPSLKKWSVRDKTISSFVHSDKH